MYLFKRIHYRPTRSGTRVEFQTDTLPFSRGACCGVGFGGRRFARFARWRRTWTSRMRHQRAVEGAGGRTAREASRHGVDGHRHRRGGDPGDAPAARLRRTALRGGASARRARPAAAGSPPHGHSGVARRPAAGGAGAPPPGQAGARRTPSRGRCGTWTCTTPRAARSYRANQAFYALGQIAQMLLRAVQFTKLPRSARRHGIRPVIRHVMRAVARLVHSARQWRLTSPGPTSGSTGCTRPPRPDPVSRTPRPHAGGDPSPRRSPSAHSAGPIPAAARRQTDRPTHPPTKKPSGRTQNPPKPPPRHSRQDLSGNQGVLWLPPCGSMVLIWLCWSISDGRPALASSRRSSACRIGGDCRHGRHDDVGVLQLTPRGCMSCRAALLFLTTGARNFNRKALRKMPRGRVNTDKQPFDCWSSPVRMCRARCVSFAPNPLSIRTPKHVQHRSLVLWRTLAGCRD